MKQIMLIVVLLTSVSRAEEQDWQQKIRKQLSLSGEVETKAVLYQNDRDRLERHQVGVDLTTELSFKPSPNWLVYAKGQWQRDSASYSQGAIDRHLETGRRWSLNVPEAYLRYRQKWLEVKVGKQVFDWSTTDTISPNDNLAPRDWTEIIDFERVAVPALSLKITHDNSFLQIVAVPWHTPSKMPAGRWERETALEVDRHDHERKGSQPQIALRVGTTVSGFDLGASYYNGVSYSPVFRADPVKGKLVPLYYRQQVWATSVAKELRDGYVARVEAGYFDQKLGPDFAQFVVGVDKEWFELMRETDSLYVLLQYSDSFDTTSRDLPPGVAGYDIRRVLDKALMTKVKYHFSDQERWAVGLEAAYNLERGDSYAKPFIAFEGDKWKAELSYSAFNGKSNRFFGGYDRNQNATLTLGRKF